MKKYTWQGLGDETVWSRGQAWGVYGFTSVYKWTKEKVFLHTARKMADYFLSHLESDGVPLWDFEAPSTDPRDTSAATTLASGLLLMAEVEPLGSEKYARAGKKLIDDVLKSYKAPVSDFIVLPTGGLQIKELGYEAVVTGGTSNNNTHGGLKQAIARVALSYGDYYLLEALNRFYRLESSGVYATLDQIADARMSVR